MATNYVLIDFENVQPSNLDVLQHHPFQVLVFVGATQTKVPFDLAAAMQALGNSAQYVKIAGSGKNALGPVVFAVFPGIIGGNSLFAPGYQYVFDIGGDEDRSDISRSQIDLYFVWQLAKGKNWLILDPQIILDHENSTEFGTVEAEWGFMIAPKQGISAYVRPGAGLGADRPYDWNLEFAVKFVWR